MASVTTVGSTWTTTAGDKTLVATPPDGALIAVICAATGVAPTALVDNAGNVYVKVAGDFVGFSTTGNLNAWVGNFPAEPVSTTWTSTQTSSTGGGLVVIAVTGMIAEIFGLAAIRASGGQSTVASGTPAPVLSATPQDSDVIFTAVASGTNGGGTTVRTGYTDIAVAGYNTPATGLDACWENVGETSATITWGGAAPSQFASIAIAIKTFDQTAQGQPSVFAFPNVPLSLRFHGRQDLYTSPLALLVQQALTATVTTTASFQNQIAKGITATATTTASIVKQVNKGISATVTSAATIVKTVLKNLSATVTSTASLLAQKVILLALTATVTTTASITNLVKTTLSATVTTSASVTKLVKTTLIATVSTTVSLVTQKLVGGIATFVMKMFSRGDPGGTATDSAPDSPTFDAPESGGQTFSSSPSSSNFDPTDPED